MTSWKTSEYLAWIASGCPMNTSVIELDLYNSQLSELHPCIGNLKHLRSLYLTHNLLTTLPAGICKLRNLRTLVLSNNMFQTIPQVIFSLVNLQNLGVSRNQITVVSTEIEKLKIYTSLISQVTNLSILFPKSSS
jgi:Leucine-rich repeat (LRR) protein